MVTCIRYDCQDEGQWDAFVEASRSPLFFFKRRFLEYHSDRFTDASLMFYEDDVLVCVLPATVHDKKIISHGGVTYGGFIYSPKIRTRTLQDVFECFKQWALSQDVEQFVYKAVPYIFNRQPAQEDLYFIHHLLDGKLVRRDLSSIIFLKDRLKLSKGRKWLIARAKKLGLSVSESQDWEGFHALLTEVLAKHDAKPVHSVAELKLLKSRFEENIVLNVIMQDGGMLAAALLFKFDNVIHTQYLATNDQGKEMGALDYLIEHAIEDGASVGNDYFSFGISTEDHGRTLNDGLLQQKESFGARGMAIDFYEINFK